MRQITRGPRAPRPKRPTEWVASTAGYGTPFNLINAGASTLTSVSLLDTSAPATAVGRPVFDRFTVMRIIGDWQMVTTAGNVANVAWKLHLGIIAAQASAFNTATFDPSASTDADAPWLWLRHFQMTQTGGALFPVDEYQVFLPQGTHVDVKQKRIMRPDMTLLLMAKATFDYGGGGALTQSFTPYLRTLIARAI